MPGVVSLSDYVPFLIFFFLISLTRFSELEVEVFCYALISTVPHQLILSILERYVHGRFYFFDDRLPIFDFYLLDIHFVPGLRTSAGFFNPNILSCYCVICGGVALGLLIKEMENVRSERDKKLFSLVRILVVLTCFTFCIVLLVWSESDGGIITFLIAIILLLAWIKNKFLYIGIFGFVSTLLTLIASNKIGWITQLLSFIIPQKLLSLLVSALQSFDDRVLYYKCAVQLIQEKPITGWGIGKFASECSSRTGIQMVHAHNIVLQLGGDVGLPCTILLGCLVGYLIFSCILFIRQERSKQNQNSSLYLGIIVTTISVVLMQFFDLALLMSYRLNFLFWICLAIPYSLASQPKVLKISQG